MEVFIFWVAVFQIQANGNFKMRVHMVAARTSAEAEEKIKQQPGGHLTGQCYIHTDEWVKYGSKGIEWYATEWRNEDLTRLQYAQWRKRSTTGAVFDGEYDPAAYRRFK